MSDETNQDLPPETAQEEPAPQAPRASFSGWPGLLLALAAGVGGGYLWYAGQQRGTGLDRDLTELRQQASKMGAARAQGEAQLGKALATLGERHRTVEQGMARLTEVVGRDRDRWRLEEVRQLITLANSRLQLARDYHTAGVALETAQARLGELGDPRLLKVRRQLANDIAALNSAPRIDLAGLALRLGGLARAVDALPLKAAAHLRTEDGAPDAAQEGSADSRGWRRVGTQVWQDLRSLVRIRELDAPHPPLLPPEQAYFLRENLRLMLNGAQLALLRGVREVYVGNLGTAAGWVEEHFERDAGPVQALLAELTALRRTDPMPQLPDISRSLEALGAHLQNAARP